MNETANVANDYRAFYVKCRPQDADALPLCRRLNRVFIGYPPWRAGHVWDRHKIQQAMLDISVSDAAWRPSDISDDVRKTQMSQISGNRKFALMVEPGSIVVVPRPRMGVCFIAPIQSRFELVNAPHWAEDYLGLRKHQGLIDNPEDAQYLIGDVVQGWTVRDFREVPFPMVPRWISYSLLSRNTIGWINDRPDGRRLAVDVLHQLYSGAFNSELEPTVDPDEVEGRLLDWVSPYMLEHLVCALLQLEEPDVRWFHIGGPGDGGADGLVTNKKGEVAAALTCKWKFDGDPQRLGKEVLDQLREKWPAARVYVAVLYNEFKDRNAQGAVIVWDRHRIAGLLIKHRSACPWANTLSVS